MTLIKICGITRKVDLNLVMAAGADLVGFNIYPGSKRYIGPEKLANFLKDEKTRKKAAIVSVNEPPEILYGIIDKYRPAYIQLHGDKDWRTIKSIKERFSSVRIIKKVDINSAATYKNLLRYADYLICDVKSPDYGGTGNNFNWNKLKNIDKKVREKLFVAGGVTPENITELLKYGVYGVDVATGTEKEPGKKGKKKVFNIVKKVKKYG